MIQEFNVVYLDGSVERYTATNVRDVEDLESAYARGEGRIKVYLTRRVDDIVGNVIRENRYHEWFNVQDFRNLVIFPERGE